MAVEQCRCDTCIRSEANVLAVYVAVLKAGAAAMFCGMSRVLPSVKQVTSDLFVVT